MARGDPLKLTDHGENVHPSDNVGLLGIEDSMVRLWDQHIAKLFHHPLCQCVGSYTVTHNGGSENGGSESTCEQLIKGRAEDT